MKISDEKRHEIYMLRLSFMPLKEIKQKTGVSISTIQKIFKEEKLSSHIQYGTKIELNGKYPHELVEILEKEGYKFDLLFGEKITFYIWGKDITKEIIEGGSR